ncbi:type II toxin-antitoxin system VapC family toxin [Candidatus Electrothrix sp.]
MTRKVYIETSIISYLTSRSTNNLIAAARKNETVHWWEHHKKRFSLYVSNLVIEEAGRGDKEAAAKRLDVIADIETLPVTSEAVALSEMLIRHSALPEKATDDALHISIACVHRVDFLLTWNCKHIDNAEKKPLIREICKDNGFICPEIATPAEMMGD